MTVVLLLRTRRGGALLSIALLAVQTHKPPGRNAFESPNTGLACACYTLHTETRYAVYSMVGLFGRSHIVASSREQVLCARGRDCFDTCGTRELLSVPGSKQRLEVWTTVREALTEVIAIAKW